MRLSIIPFVIIALFAVEIAAFILVGREIGVLATLLLILATTVAGAAMLRIQGFGILARIRRELDAGRVPGRELAHGLLILLAGIVLMIPGFITDILGFLLFIPGIRDLLWSAISNRVLVVARSQTFRAAWPREPQTIDLSDDDYSEDPNGRPPPRLPPGA